jgi:protection-of-telomeres protein 1
MEHAPISTLLETVYHPVSVDGADGPVMVPLPFNVAKYRVVARVVDFSPRTLEKFCYQRRVSEYRFLSDHESDSEEDGDDASNGHWDGAARKWEWRFALQLEDASPLAGKNPGRVWVYVDNAEAQYLTGLDASECVL